MRVGTKQSDHRILNAKSASEGSWAARKSPGNFPTSTEASPSSALPRTGTTPSIAARRALPQLEPAGSRHRENGGGGQRPDLDRWHDPSAARCFLHPAKQVDRSSRGRTDWKTVGRGVVRRRVSSDGKGWTTDQPAGRSTDVPASFILSLRNGAMAIATPKGLFRFEAGRGAPWINTAEVIYRGSGQMIEGQQGTLWKNRTHVDWYYRGQRTEAYPAEKSDGFRTTQGTHDATPALAVVTIVLPLWRQGWIIGLAVSVVGMPIAMIVVVIRQRVRHALEIERVKLRFFTNISHEIKAPLSLILGPVEELEQHLTVPRQRQHLSLIKVHSERLLSLVTQLLDFRKLQLGKLDFNPEQTDFIAFVRQCTSSFETSAKERNVTLVVDSPLPRSGVASIKNSSTKSSITS